MFSSFFQRLTALPEFPVEYAEAAPATIARRITALVYESILMLALLMILSLFLLVVQALLHIVIKSLAYKIIFFVVLGAYFVYCWTHSGQTLAMRVWRIRVQTNEGYLLSTSQALMRYLIGWMWVFPAALYNLIVHTSLSQGLISYGLNIIFWGGTFAFLSNGQFLHDFLTRCKVVDLADTSLN